MKKFADLTQEEFRQIINRSKELRDELDRYIQDSEMNWLEEKFSCVRNSLSEWSIGFFNRNFMRVRDCADFLEGVIESRDCFGASDRLEKLIDRCKKLSRTNLFEFYVNKLKEVFYEDELKSIIDYVEECSYELSCGSVGEKSEDYLEIFSYNYEDYLYDEENEIYYRPNKLAA